MLGTAMNFSRGRGEDRFYNPPQARRALHTAENDRIRRAHSDVTPSRSSSVVREKSVDSVDKKLENRVGSEETKKVVAVPSCEPEVKRLSNLERFLESITPSVPAQHLSKRSARSFRTCNEEVPPYFVLGDLWESFREWSAYGAGVPLVLNDKDSVVQYYVPYLSGIQIYVQSAKPPVKSRQLGEDSDSDFRDSSSDGSSDCEPVRGYREQRNLPHLSDEVSHWMGRLSVRNQHTALQDGFSSDDGESVNSQGYLLFEYLERDPPYGREPLADKITDLAFRFPQLLTLRSCDILSSSWISVAWYPIYRIPMGPTLKDLDACFLTYHSLYTPLGGSQRVHAPVPSYPTEIDGVPKMSLPVFGLASYKFKGPLWTPSGGYERQLSNSLLQNADKWLRLLQMDLIKERPLEFIGDITDKKDFWKLAVRVQDKWTVVKNGKEHLELVIVDSKGHDVQVVVPTDYKANSDKILEPNTTYVLSNFQVMINNLTFKASDHKFHLKWTGGTTAVDVNVHNIPAPAIKFKSFAEIIAGKWKPDLLVNVIGVVQDMGYCQLNEGSGKKLQVNFTMRDLSDMTLNCTLWEDYAAKFIKYMGDKKQGGPVVVMLKYAKIKEEGRYPLTVSNTYGYTRLFINDNLPEINNFKGSLPKDDVSQSQSQLMCTQSYSSSQLTSEEDFLSNNMILPIANIIQLDQITYCVTAATIEKVKSTRHGWYYFACHKCPKIAKGDNAPYTCEDGHNTETEIVKYKLEMEISYEGEVVTFVFWDREVTQLLGVSASHLRSNMIQAGITNRLEYPLMMDGLAGKNFVAKVKWQPRWKTFSVVCLKVEPELFAKVITKFPNYQPASVHVQDDPTDDTIGDIQVQDNDHTVSTHDMSASSEYDPDSLNQITPLSKMKTVDASQNYESLSQLTPNYLKSVAEATPAQLAPPNNSAQPDTTDEITPAKQSSSKRVRLIKQEKK